jgi:hypothetical protein
MAKYYASPFGSIRGKVNGSVGVGWKGKNVLRKYAIPTDRGSLLKYQQYKGGIIPPDLFSFPQFNLRRVCNNPLFKIAHDHFQDFIVPIWKEMAREKRLLMSGTNLFMRTNTTTIYASFDKTIEYDASTNKPDLTKLILVDGELETTQSMTATYDPSSGFMNFTWNTHHYTNGKDTDTVYAIILKEPVVIDVGATGHWQPSLVMFGPTQLRHDLAAATRADGAGLMTITPGLTASNLIAYLFFCGAANIESVLISKEVVKGLSVNRVVRVS